MSKWKLYWVASDGYEDCFVVAKNSRSAKRIEKETNGFEDDDLTVTRIMDIPDEYEAIANKKALPKWPYYAPNWLLEELGAEYRTIDGQDEILINDIVISGDTIYSVRLRAMDELAKMTGDKIVDISRVSYEGMREAIDSMLGAAITTIHRIENYITESFIFAIGNKKYDNYTIEEATKLWKDKFTFGNLMQLIEKRYEIDETVHRALHLFLVQRNKIAHGLTKDPRYDIDTIWGQKEIVRIPGIIF